MAENGLREEISEIQLKPPNGVNKSTQLNGNELRKYVNHFFAVFVRRLAANGPTQKDAKCQQPNRSIINVVIAKRKRYSRVHLYIYIGKNTQKITFNWIPFRTNEHCSDKVFQLNGGWFCFHANWSSPYLFVNAFRYAAWSKSGHFTRLLRLDTSRAFAPFDWRKTVELITSFRFGTCRPCDNFDSFRWFCWQTIDINLVSCGKQKPLRCILHRHLWAD